MTIQDFSKKIKPRAKPKDDNIEEEEEEDDNNRGGRHKSNSRARDVPKNTDGAA